MIQTILAFTGGHIVAGVFCAIAAAGWTVQGLGNAFYFRQVRRRNQNRTDVSTYHGFRFGSIAKPPVTLSKRLIVSLLSCSYPCADFALLPRQRESLPLMAPRHTSLGDKSYCCIYAGRRIACCLIVGPMTLVALRIYGCAGPCVVIE